MGAFRWHNRKGIFGEPILILVVIQVCNRLFPDL